jgi:DNA-binding transcriptional ArsR family regulator
MKPGNLYRREFLLGDLLAAARKQNKNQFVEFQGLKSIELCRSPLFDFLAVNILRLKPDGMLDGGMVSAVHNVSPLVISNYEKNLILDDFTPLLFERLGSALFNDAVRPMEDWIDRPIYTNHCSIFDYYRVCEVAYSYPFHSNPKIVMFISTDNNRNFPAGLDENLVEYIFFPFYLGWLHVYRLIDAETLQHWLSLLAGMTLPRFRLLRSLFEPCTLSTKQLAESLELSPSAINRHLESSMENLMSISPYLQEKDGNINRLAELLKAYRFFEFAPSSIKRTLPKRSNQDW